MKTLIIMMVYALIFMLSVAYAKTATDMAENRTTNHSIDQNKVIHFVKKTENYIKKNGVKKAIIAYRKSSNNIFIGDYSGMFFVSPLHPELIGNNEFNYKDSFGVLVVQEEIEKAKAGGGWLKGRWRENPKTGKYQCRKIYILPVPGNYYIGSWYHYSSDKPGTCLI